jgi:hypothetical protein
MKHLRRVSIKGEPWTVEWIPESHPDFDDRWGDCTDEFRRIRLTRDLPQEGEVKSSEIVIHEMLHAEFPKASERTVTQAARDIAKALGRFGLVSSQGEPSAGP